MYGLLNIGSLVLGLFALILPFISLMKKDQPNQLLLLSLGSLSACATAICLQIYYQAYLVEIEDWTALMDTTRAAASISLLLLAGTIILNCRPFIIYLKRQS